MSDWNGIPDNPAVDGWHWLKHPEDLRPCPVGWDAMHSAWCGGGMHSSRGIIELGYTYLGPLILPADHAAAVEAAVQAEREGIAKWHDCNATIYEVTAAKLTGANRDSFEGYAKKHREYAAAIRARGPTDALAAALAKAREDERQAMWAAIRQLPGLHADQALALDQIVAIRALAGKERGE